MIALLDTSVLIAGTTTSERAPDLSGFTDYVVSSLSYSEIHVGLGMQTALPAYKDRLQRLHTIQSVFGPGIPFDDQSAQAMEALTERIIHRDGNPRGHLIDRMIAATAIAHDFTLVTRNTGDFDAFRDLLELETR